MSPRAVLWDIDGTLVESTELALGSTNAVLKSNGFGEISLADYKVGIKYATPFRMAFHAKGNPDDPCGPDLAKQFDEHYIALVSPVTASLFEGLADLLREIQAKGCRQAALSNACTSYVTAVADAHGLAKILEVQLGADKVPAPKPSPDGLLLICRELGLSPSDCAYVGDAPTDGQAARAAGLRAVGVAWAGADGGAAIAGDFDAVACDAQGLREILFGS